MTELKLRPYQVEDLAFIMRENRFGLLSDPRTGKTPPVCVFFWWLWDEKKQKGIWSMPKSLLAKNYDELLRWSSFKPNEVCIWDGKNDNSDHKVFLCTFKRFAMSWRALLDRHTNINAHAVDEIHFDGGFRKHDSQNTKALFESGHKIERFIPMTGSLINGMLSSAYPTIHMIEPRYYTSHENFLAYHAVRDDLGKITGWANHDRLRKIIEAHSSRRSFADVFGDKTIVLDVERVKMSPMQRDKYDEFHENAVLELEDRWLDGTLPGVNTIRCRQIMGHPEAVRLPIAYDDKGRPTAYKVYNLIGDEQTGKDAALHLHLVNHLNTGKPVIVFASLIEEQNRCLALARKVGLRADIINSEVASLNKRRAIDEYFRAGKLDCVVASGPTASVGYNWGHVDHTIFVSIDYQDTNFLQGLMRGMTGDKTGFLVSILEYERSVDQRMFQIVEQKSRDANKVDPTRPIISLASGKILLARENKP